MTGLAVNITLVPAQIDPFGDAAMLTEGVGAGITVIVIELDVAGFPVTPDILDVIIQVTICPLDNVDVV